MPFAARLRIVLSDLGWSQTTAADKFKVHRRTVGNWLAGKDVPSFHTGCRIAAETQKSPFYFSGITNHPGVGILTDEERDMLQLYRELAPSDRRIWRESLRDAGSIERISKKAKAA